MDEIIIFDIYQFISFALCKRYLEKGFQVSGSEIINDYKNNYREEKNLEIGRNANFTEVKNIELLLCPKTLSNKLIIISLYDFYMEEDSPKLSKLLSHGKNIIKIQAQLEQCQLILLLPINVINNNSEHDFKLINDFINDAEQNSKRDFLKLIYLPTVYGPWQPASYYFHKIIKNSELNRNNKNIKLNKRELTNDAIYIDDVIETIIKIINNNDGQSIFVLKSKLKDHWQHCSNVLLKDYNLSQRPRLSPSIKLPFSKTIVNNSLSIKDGLNKQREQMLRQLLN